MTEVEENMIRKSIWTRAAALAEKVSETAFADLPDAAQDAWVLSLMLDIPLETAEACVGGTASEADLETVRGRIAESFKYGKRKALRPLKDVLGRYEHLQK